MTIPSSPAPPKPAAEPTPLVQTRITNRLAEFPWWGLVLALMGVLLVFSFATNATYQDIIVYLVVGIRLTVTVTLVSPSGVPSLSKVWSVSASGKVVVSTRTVYVPGAA